MEQPYWLAEQAPPLPRRRLPAHVDVAVVGAGITGCAAALALAEQGLKVRVYEKRTVASGASGRNGGFALRGTAASYLTLRARHGAGTAAALWRWTEQAQARMQQLAPDAFERRGSVRLAADGRERDHVRREYEALAEDGLAATWCEPFETPAGAYPAALLHPGDGALQPARLVRRLAVQAAEAGAEFREQTQVRELERLPADRVLVATDGYGHGLARALDGCIWPVRGQVVVSEPLSRRLYDIPHYARDGFDYWQQLPDGRLLLGGFRDVAMLRELTHLERTTRRIQRPLERFLRGLAPGEQPRVAYRWSGIFGITEDLLPLVGPLPDHERVWVAGGYSGHGMVLGFACGELAAQALTGSAVDQRPLALFAPTRFAGRRPRNALSVAWKIWRQRSRESRR